MRLLDVMANAILEAGGPVEIVRQNSRTLQELGHVTEMVCLDDPATLDMAALPMRVYALGPSRGSYCFNTKLVPWLRQNVGQFDAVVVHGIWQQHDFGTWRALRRSAIPYFVFPHGMLDPYFKRAFPLKHLKKCLYWPLQYRILRDARACLFTCEEERLLARQSFWPYRVNEQVVRFGTAAPGGDPEFQRQAFLDQFSVLRDRPFLLNLGRIHPKKGHDLLIRAYAQVFGGDPNAPLLVFAGPDQVGWKAELEQLADQLQVADQIVWTGMLTGDVKLGAFRACDAFILPSHQENFGIVVAEAMACAKPVLLTDKVNIWREVVMDKAGLSAPDTVEGIVDLLVRFRDLPNVERDAMGGRALKSFSDRFEIHAAASSLLGVIRQSLGQGS